MVSSTESGSYYSKKVSRRQRPTLLTSGKNHETGENYSRWNFFDLHIDYLERDGI